MGFAVGQNKGRVAPQMNVTPLVDVVLVLLIIFMVVTPLLTKKFWLNVPKDAEPETATSAPPPSAIVLSLAANGIVRLNGAELSSAEIGARLGAALARRGDGVVFFDAEDEAAYGTAVDLMDLAKASGATTVAIVPAALSP